MSVHWFVGVDLAWSPRNATGVALLRGNGNGVELVKSTVMFSIDEIADTTTALPGDWYVAVDAPLVVRSEDHSREVDKAITRLYGRFHAGAYPATLQLLRWVVRGNELVQRLRQHGVQIADRWPHPPQRPGRWIFESYPHAGMVELFGLERIIRYKKGRVAERRDGQKELTQKFRTQLSALDLPLRSTTTLEDMLNVDLTSLRGKALKQHEDRLDGLFAGYLAAHLWRWGEERNQVLGTPEDGAVILPKVRADVCYEAGL